MCKIRFNPSMKEGMSELVLVHPYQWTHFWSPFMILRRAEAAPGVFALCVLVGPASFKNNTLGTGVVWKWDLKAVAVERRLETAFNYGSGSFLC